MTPKKYRLIKQLDEWVEDNGTKMPLGRVISEDETLNQKPFSYWLSGQEEYWEEITKILTLKDVYLEKIKAANEDDSFSQFIFSFENEKYLVEWEYGIKWSNPVKIIEL